MIGASARPSIRISLILAVLCLTVTGSAHAQDSDLNALASQVAQSLKAAKLKNVAVFDFTGPGENVTALGPKLADDFSQALSRSNRHLHVENRAAVAREMKESDYTPVDELYSDSILALAAYIDLDAAVLGTISTIGDQIKVSVRVAKIAHGHSTVVDTKDATLPLPADDAKQLQTYLARVQTAEVFKNFPDTGKGGISYPSCVYCPQAQYTDAAVKHHLQGTVELVGVIDTNGRASEVKAVKHLPGGLSDSAVDSLKQWRFKPALDANGNPVAVRQIIEVTFHLY